MQKPPVPLRTIAAGLVLLLAAAPTLAVDFEKGKLRGHWDNTLTLGSSWRTQKQDPRIIGLTNGGTAFSVNGDDGNLNYPREHPLGVFGKPYSLLFRWTSELELDFKRWGGFFRGTAFYDYITEETNTARTPLNDLALERVGSRAELLDAYAWVNFNIAGASSEVRVGQQVLNWGESLFIPGGINVVNHIDIAAFRTPGVELREVLLPDGLVWGSFATSTNTALQAFYQYDWEQTFVDPPGSYWSTNDFVGRGGSKVYLGFGSISDQGTTLPGIGDDPNFLAVLRSPDRTPKDSGQYGAAFRWFVPRLGDTEFGFYYVRYHSRLPFVNATTGTQAARDAADLFFATNPLVLPIQLLVPVSTDIYSKSARYFVDYPEDIDLYGFSYNAQLGPSGVALQGELSYRPNAPFQLDDVEVLFAGLSPLNFNAAFKDNQLGSFATSTDISGYRRHRMGQLQTAATKVWGAALGAAQIVLIGEVAVQYADLPSKDVQRFEGAGTYTSGNPRQSSPPGAFYPLGGAHAGKRWEDAGHFADNTSWGYRLATRWEFNNVLGAWNFRPLAAWGHDVNGISPGPGGPFLEDRKALTLGLGTDWQARWEVNFRYASFFGASRYNLVNDRDFVSASVRYFF